MPIFEYICKVCGHIFSEIKRYEDSDTLECEHGCGLTSIRLPSLPSPARGSFGTVSRRPSKASTVIRDEKLKAEFKKEE